MAMLRQLAFLVAIAQASSLPIGADSVSLIQHQPASKIAHFDEGELVEIPVQIKGDKDATWIPATVVKPRFEGFYDVRVELGPGDRFVAQIPGLKADVPRKLDKRSDWDHSKHYYASNPRDAKQVIEQVFADIQRRTRTSLYAKGLTKHQVEKRMVQLDKANRVKLERDARKQGCPSGYRAVEGDGKGNDHFGRDNRNKQDTIDLCKQDCEKHSACKSFEWSPNTKTCNLNRVSEPFKAENFLDFVYCQKV